MTRIPWRFRDPLLRAARFVAQRAILKPVIWSITRVRVVGRENLASLTTPFVVIANHASHLDAPLVLGALPWRYAKRLAVAAAADYFFTVRWRTWLTVLFLNTYPVDRGNESGNRRRLSSALLSGGFPLLVFPEGGRASSALDVRPFQQGVGALAIRTGCAVVPIGIIGTAVAMPRGQGWPTLGRPAVAVVIGAPVRADGDDTPESFTLRLEQRVRTIAEGAPVERGVA